MKDFRVQDRSLIAPLPFAGRPAAHPVPRSNMCLNGFLASARPDPDHFAYALIANVRLLKWYHRDAEYRRYVQRAEVVLAAGRASAWLIRQLHGVHVPICSPASVTNLLLQISRPTDRILWVGPAATFDAGLSSRGALGYCGRGLAGCIDFIENNEPFRFCLLALSSPEQELVAHDVLMRGRARGLALCVGPGYGCTR